MTDDERMADLLRRRADVYHPDRQKPSYYGDDDIDLLRAKIEQLTELVSRQAKLIADTFGERGPAHVVDAGAALDAAAEHGRKTGSY